MKGGTRYGDSADDDWLEVLTEAAARVAVEIERFEDMKAGGERPDQYAFDLVADRVVLEVLEPTGASTFSEESGHRITAPEAPVVIIEKRSIRLPPSSKTKMAAPEIGLPPASLTKPSRLPARWREARLRLSPRHRLVLGAGQA